MKELTMPIKPEHLDELLAGYEKPEDLLAKMACSSSSRRRCCCVPRVARQSAQP